MATSYNLIERDKENVHCQESVGLVEFLRRVASGEALPNPLRVRGLDAVLEEARDEIETATLIRNLLAEHSESMGHQDVFVVFPMWADLEESGRQGVICLPKGSRRPKTVYVRNLFGNRWTRLSRHWFQAGSNVTRA
jgi:hypothetical protein